MFVFDYGYAGPIYRAIWKRHIRGRDNELGAVWRSGSGWQASRLPSEERKIYRTRAKAAQHLIERYYQR